MKTPVTLRVPIDETWDAGVRLQVYTDRGSGTIDLNAPLLARAHDVFPAGLAARGFGLHPMGRGAYGTQRTDRPRTGGYGDPPYGETPYGHSQAYVRVTARVPAAFGKWKFGVEAVDAQGNVQDESLAQIERMVSGIEPAPLRAFSFGSYDGPTDRVTFGFALNTE